MATLKPFKKIKIPTREVEQMQESISQTVNPVIRKEILNGLLIKDVDLDSGVDNFVEHKLGRKLIGYVVVRKNVPAVINDKQETNQQSDRFLILNCTVGVRVTLWLF